MGDRERHTAAKTPIYLYVTIRAGCIFDTSSSFFALYDTIPCVLVTNQHTAPWNQLHRTSLSFFLSLSVFCKKISPGGHVQVIWCLS